MIPFKAGSRKFSIPTDWSEITLEQSIRFMQMSKDLPDDEQYLFILSVFTGMTIDECRKISLFDVKKILMPLIGFLNQPVNQDELMNRPLPEMIQVGDNLVKKFYSPGQMTWAQHLNFDNIITDKVKTDIEKIPDIIAICIQKPSEFNEEAIEQIKTDALKMSLFDAFSIAGYYMRGIKSFYEKANMKDTTEYTAEQIRAGIKEFSKFGAFNSIDTLAGGDITKWDKVVQLPMADVIIKLKMNQQHYKYEKKYNEIMTKKK